MRKFTLLILAVMAGMVTASAASTLEFHFNANQNWSGAESYPTFTDKGLNPDNSNEELYEFVLNSSNGLSDGDIYFRLHYQGWKADIGPANNFTYDFAEAKIWGSYHQWHGEANWDNTNYYCIPQSTVKASEYKITVYAQQENHYNIKVEIVKMPATVSSLGYSTFSCPYALDLSDVTAYKASVNNEKKVVLSKVTGNVPAGTGLILAGESKNIPVVETSAATALEGNLLVASLTDTEVAASTAGTYHYFLAGSDAESLGFYNLAVAATSSAGKAYLETSTELAAETVSARVSWIFQDDATAINAVENAQNAETVYDLQGRVAKTAKAGLYIKNGKKFIVK